MGVSSIPSSQTEVFEGMTPGYGKQTASDAAVETAERIAKIEANTVMSESEKTAAITRIQKKASQAFTQEGEFAEAGLLKFIETDRVESQALGKWWAKYEKTRDPFYSSISYRSYRPETIERAGFLSTIGIDPATMKDLTTGEKVNLQDIPSRIAMREKNMYLSGERVLSLSRMAGHEGDLFMGRPTEGGSKIFMSNTAQRALAGEMFGQSRVLRDVETGQIIPLGSRIVSEDIVRSGAITQREYLNSLRALYFDAVKKGKIVDIGRYGKLLSDATPDIRAFNPLVSGKDIKINKRLKDIRRALSSDHTLARDIMSVRDTQRVTYRGFERIRDLMEGSELGREFRVGGRRAVVSPLERLEDVTLLRTGGKGVVTYGDLMRRTMKLDPRIAAVPDIFEAFVVREPYTKMPKVGAGGVAAGEAKFYPYTLRVMMGPDKVIGTIPAALEGRIGTEAGREIAEGYAGKVFIRPYAVSERVGKRYQTIYRLGVWKTLEEAYETTIGATGRAYSGPIRFDRLKEENLVRAHWLYQSEIQSLLRNTSDDWKNVATLEETMRARYPSRSVSQVYGKDAARAWKDAAIGIKRQSIERGRISKRSMALAGIIVAGALLTWGASRIKNRAPITERDVPESLYGSEVPVSKRAPTFYTSPPRIVQKNTGYVTNIDMEVGDDGRTEDHKGLASNMAYVARSVLGIGQIKTSMHIVDDSESISRESTRKTLNQQLRR